MLPQLELPASPRLETPPSPCRHVKQANHFWGPKIWFKNTTTCSTFGFPEVRRDNRSSDAMLLCWASDSRIGRRTLRFWGASHDRIDSCLDSFLPSEAVAAATAAPKHSSSIIDNSVQKQVRDSSPGRSAAARWAEKRACTRLHSWLCSPSFYAQMVSCFLGSLRDITCSCPR